MPSSEDTLVIRGGTVVGPTGLARSDVAVGGGRVLGLADAIEPPQGAVVLDAGGCLVGPGLVDLHTHLRQPGREEAETIETGARAAALGGYTAIVAMPNTEPPIDSAGVVREILDLAAGAAAEVAVAGAITLGRAGTALAPLGELAALGVTLFTDDGAGVQDGALMRRALDYAKGIGVTLAQHCEDACLAAGGAMHEGAWSSRLGIPGMPAAAEEAMVARDIALVRLTGAHVHFLHLSTAGSVDLVRRAKTEGLPVTAEAAPHHMLLTHAAVAGYDPVFKVNPPLRTDEDVAAVVAGLCDGTIDAVATDHAPHAPEAKDVAFDQAPPGMLGLQTALPIAWEVLSPQLGPERLFALMSTQPAAIARLRVTDPRPAGHSAHGGPVEVGAVANLCVFDPAGTTVVDPGRLASRSRNTPYAGRTFQGAVRHTVLRGEPVVVDAVAQR
ncbi:MAG TPA: dihydroorotase [Acidimicrobiales bacterium]|nr:dihydroorotase [Acidimicrobiales bacterium]